MSSRPFVCLCAASAVLFFSGGSAVGSIVLSSVSLDTLEIGGVKVPGRWEASAPTVRSSALGYLAYDAAGKSPRVRFSKEKGPHTTWTFVGLTPFLNNEGRGTRGGWVEVTGCTLKLRATEGPYRGWYLSRSKEGRLVLTKEADRAAVLKFLLKRREVR